MIDRRRVEQILERTTKVEKTLRAGEEDSR